MFISRMPNRATPRTKSSASIRSPAGAAASRRAGGAGGSGAAMMTVRCSPGSIAAIAAPFSRTILSRRFAASASRNRRLALVPGVIWSEVARGGGTR